MSAQMPSAAEIVSFWREAGFKRWYAHDPAFDADIRTRFEAAHMAAAKGGHEDWLATAEGALALLILLDQFPRNLYRGTAHAFATDALARQVADKALAAGFDKQIEPALRPFFYLPFEHSENIEDQHRAVALCTAYATETGDDVILRYAKLHEDLIARFGRFPHRNPVMGRNTTPDEKAYLDAGGFAG